MNSSKRGRTDRVQGEGDFEADRRYRSDTRKFVRTHDIEKAARNAEPSSEAEAAAMEAAEHAGRERSKGDDQDDEMKTEETDTAYNDPQ